ncbi:MAG: hypothetical protein JO036_06590 [Candidatus Eremiobacteraeota bacterium]|nr:hypothetical protein [Candidatus Eremiobacteraeota bacterium]
MASDETRPELELVRQLSERIRALATLNADNVRQLAERSALLARMHNEAVTQFARASELLQRFAERLDARRAT